MARLKGKFPVHFSAKIIQRSMDENKFQLFIENYFKHNQRRKWNPSSLDWKYYKEGKFSSDDWQSHWQVKSYATVYHRLGKMFLQKNNNI